ncbi:hypothetical protein SCHPADRAFT_856187 [Schizopora paradoxa]|uniref:Nucleotide-sugar transporter n=1 Tax=Schizopora paradoxa TaxID=27342 RepID=A0A0H2RMQ1_9AGAM|nr:hypothetical protein SCHPADRAFT_856187 [Schizopora paradoxa]
MEARPTTPPITVPKLLLEVSSNDVHEEKREVSGEVDASPRLWGIPLKYLSLITLAVQNASLTIIMHYSRISTPSSQAYSAASAVFLNELLKGTISLAIAFSNIKDFPVSSDSIPPRSPMPDSKLRFRRATLSVHSASSFSPKVILSRCRKLWTEIFSPDCWKLSIPAILYVIQNNLQYVAASNLEPSTFQVSYQMKILTTAAFSVALLRKQISTRKWLALLALALGVGIVQIQSGSGGSHSHSGEGNGHVMEPWKGFAAVVAACFTSGLAGVYFEMVLKGSKADLWVRNVQLSLFSLIPAMVPIVAEWSRGGGSGLFSSIFANFGAWAWATVAVQVFGGLVTAVVIKYSDNILKSFATSLSIVLSFLASVVLFHFNITPTFVLGSSTVLAATWLYNKPETPKDPLSSSTSTTFPKIVASVIPSRKSSYPGSPVESDAPLLGGEPSDKRSRPTSALGMTPSPRMLANALKLITPRSSLENLAGHNESLDESISMRMNRQHSSSSAPYSGYSTPAYISRSHSPMPGGAASGVAAGTPPSQGLGLHYTSGSLSRLHSGSGSQLLVPQAQLRPNGQYFSGSDATMEISLDEPELTSR